MYLSRMTLNQSRLAMNWVSNPYRVHQRLMMASDKDPRLLFRIEDQQTPIRILAQTWREPDWSAAFKSFDVLSMTVECKLFNPLLATGAAYHFRLLANPTIKKSHPGDEQGKRIGLLKDEDQLAWLSRKLNTAGAQILTCQVNRNEMQHLEKNPRKDDATLTHLSVLFEGVLIVQDPPQLVASIKKGIGPAKGFGFGLLSLARAD